MRSVKKQPGAKVLILLLVTRLLLTPFLLKPVRPLLLLVQDCLLMDHGVDVATVQTRHLASRKCCLDERFNNTNFQDKDFLPGPQCSLNSSSLTETVSSDNSIQLAYP